jgi:hypothetical protein
MHLPSQVGVTPVHSPFSPHVLCDGPLSLYILLHVYLMVARSLVPSKRVITPLVKLPGCPQSMFAV